MMHPDLDQQMTTRWSGWSQAPQGPPPPSALLSMPSFWPYPSEQPWIVYCAVTAESM